MLILSSSHCQDAIEHSRRPSRQWTVGLRWLFVDDCQGVLRAAAALHHTIFLSHSHRWQSWRFILLADNLSSNRSFVGSSFSLVETMGSLFKNSLYLWPYSWIHDLLSMVIGWGMMLMWWDLIFLDMNYIIYSVLWTHRNPFLSFFSSLFLSSFPPLLYVHSQHAQGHQYSIIKNRSFTFLSCTRPTSQYTRSHIENKSPHPFSSIFSFLLLLLTLR